MVDGLVFKKICAAATPVIDVVFVHGLTGDAVQTWSLDGTDSEDAFWPRWICSRYADVSVYSVGYPASIFGKLAKKEMNLVERATNALEALVADNLGARPIVFVAHSLGGILVKQMLRSARDSVDADWNLVAEKTRLVVYLATPHTGAGLANVLQSVLPRLSSSHVQLLTNDSGQLDDLNTFYRDFAPKNSTSTIAYYEKHKLKGVLVVPKESADPGVAGTTAIPLDADHDSICKPKDSDALVFKSICRHLTKLIKECAESDQESGENSAFNSETYADKADSDRRDLLQKLIDAGREHEYGRANDYQNKFAQSYYKLGLHTPAKRKNDDLLWYPQLDVYDAIRRLICLLAIPESQSEGSSNITMHQLLRLAYSDQRTPATRLFRFEPWDTRDIREAVGNLVCGLDVYEAYEIQIRLRELTKKFEELDHELTLKLAAFPKEALVPSVDSLKSRLAELQSEQARLLQEIESVDDLISSDDTKGFLAERKKALDHPRFVLLDNVEDKGMEVVRSHNYQALIVAASKRAKFSHQIIFTTSMINPDLETDDFVIGPAYTHGKRTLALPS